MLSAVGTDRFHGRTGFKRKAGAPTSVPGDLPEFRGASLRPYDAEVRAPPIVSSANKPDRKTNVVIPYSRLCPLEHENGRVSPGDVAFLSKGRPGLPGYAHSQFCRLVGIDYLNRFLGKDFWKEKTIQNGQSVYSNILVGKNDVVDVWSEVPFLSEWALDGVVLSNDQPEAFYSRSEGQLFNIGLQGVCSVNNGFVSEEGLGQLSRATGAPGDAKYKGAPYHLYPLQMFDRKIRPLHELFVGLVATRIEVNKADWQFMGWWDNANNQPKTDAPASHFHHFKYITFSSAHLWDMDDSVDIFAPAGLPAMSKRRRLDKDPYEPDQTEDLRSLVGAWRVGKVVDTKAAKMPYFEGGPVETGYRVSVNVNIEWWSYKKLRVAYSTSKDAPQVADKHTEKDAEEQARKLDPTNNDSINLHSLVRIEAPVENELSVTVGPAATRPAANIGLAHEPVIELRAPAAQAPAAAELRAPAAQAPVAAPALVAYAGGDGRPRRGGDAQNLLDSIVGAAPEPPDEPRGQAQSGRTYRRRGAGPL